MPGARDQEDRDTHDKTAGSCTVQAMIGDKETGLFAYNYHLETKRFLLVVCISEQCTFQQNIQPQQQVSIACK